PRLSRRRYHSGEKRRGQSESATEAFASRFARIARTASASSVTTEIESAGGAAASKAHSSAAERTSSRTIPELRRARRRGGYSEGEGLFSISPVIGTKRTGRM